MEGRAKCGPEVVHPYFIFENPIFKGLYGGDTRSGDYPLIYLSLFLHTSFIDFDSLLTKQKLCKIEVHIVSTVETQFSS